jgi:nitrogen-specific signal transduction histidine kinase/CheY-like chemotaxis protein
VLSDITERRHIEEQLRQSQKMEAVGQLTGGIAHDFNNLLMVISGSVDLISRRVAADEKTAKLFEAARQGVARGAKLNQQLLAFARRQDLRTEVVSVNDLIPTFEHLLDRAVGEAVVVEVQRAREYWLCKTDAHQLETAILNLAINARDAMPNGGTLRLEIENRSVSKEQARLWVASGGEYVVVTLSDTGTGMSAETASRIFEPFFTTKEIGKGTGLGLSQVYGFARQSNGFVTIKTALGAGTAVSIFLPRTTELVIATGETPVTDGELAGGRGSILVVEDDEAVRSTTIAMLKDSGYTTFEATTARSALAVLESGMPIDLVFSDVIMPGGMTGVELALEIKAQHEGVLVLLTSGYTAQQIVPEHLAADIQLLRKPYTLTELAFAVRDKLLATKGQTTR